MPSNEPDPPKPDLPRPDSSIWAVPVHRRCPVTDLPRGWVQRVARRALRLEAAPAGEVSVLLTTDAEIRELNRTWRDVDAATDVLSFPQLEAFPACPGSEPLLLGDIAISLDTAAVQAQQLDSSLSVVVAHLVVHGVLHLLGYDHVTDAERQRMQEREGRILDTLGAAPVLWPEPQMPAG